MSLMRKFSRNFGIFLRWKYKRVYTRNFFVVTYILKLGNCDLVGHNHGTWYFNVLLRCGSYEILEWIWILKFILSFKGQIFLDLKRVMEPKVCTSLQTPVSILSTLNAEGKPFLIVFLRSPTNPYPIIPS